MNPRIGYRLLVLLSAMALASGTASAQTQDALTESRGSERPYGLIKCEIDLATVVQKDENPDIERAFVPVSVPSIGDSLIVDFAELVLTVATVYDSTEPLFLVAAPATSAPQSRPNAWQADWSSMSGGFDTEYLAVTPINSSETELEVRLDVTTIVRRWASGDSPNNGFVLKSLAESKSTFHWIRDGRYDGDDARLEVRYSENPFRSE